MNATLSANITTSNCSIAPPGTRFDLGACYFRTIGCPWFPHVPFDICKLYCGSVFGYYDLVDIFSALITWVTPLFGLMANMHFAESTLHGLGTGWPKMSNMMDKWLPKWSPRWLKWLGSQLPKHFVFSVQLANPIGTIWSLADKLDLAQQLWNHCANITDAQLDLEDDQFDRARRDIANVCNVLDDFGYEKFQRRVNRLVELVKMKRVNSKHGSVARAVYKHVKLASRDLAIARIRDTLHAFFAILVYVGNAVAALLTSINASGLDYSQPHTIALRELCFFLLAQVILSSAAGRWAQQWRPQIIMRHFAAEILEIEKDIPLNIADSTKFFIWEDLAEEEIALWDGGSYLFRPQKSYSYEVAHSEGEFSRSNNGLFLLGMAWLMVVLAFSVSFIISWMTPTTGIGGRGLAEILYISVWIGNFLLEECWIVRLIDPCKIEDRKWLFLWVWTKDGVVSLLAFLFFFLPFIGWYNSCMSWSAWFSRWNNGYVDLMVATTESWLSYRLYLTGIIAGSVIQILLALFIVFKKRKVYALSSRSNEENEANLCNKVKVKNYSRKSMELLPRTYSDRWLEEVVGLRS